MFFSTATPFTRSASSMASGGSGSAPAWKPAPTRKTLANWSSPNSPRTSRRTSSRTAPSRTRAVIGWLTTARSGKDRVGSDTIGPVGTSATETTATVRSASATVRFFGSAATRRSHPR